MTLPRRDAGNCTHSHNDDTSIYNVKRVTLFGKLRKNRQCEFVCIEQFKDDCSF